MMWEIASVVFAKEMRTVIASRRMLALVAILPLLMFPAASMLVSYVVASEVGMTEEAVVGVTSTELRQLYAAVIPERWELRDVGTDADELVQDGTLDALLDLVDRDEGTVHVDVRYMAGSTKSMVIASKLGTLTETANEAQLTSRGIKIPVAVSAELVDVSRSKGAELGAFLLSLAGTMVIISCLTGASSLANAVSVVERERGTMEALYATGADPRGIALGKLAAVSATSFISGGCAAVGILLADTLLLHVFDFGASQLVMLMLAVVCGSLLSSSVLVLVGQASKTVRDAQTISNAIMVVAMAPLYLTASIVVGREPVAYWAVPVLNTSCLVARAARGIGMGPVEVVLAIGSTAVVVTACTALGIRSFRTGIG